MSQETVFTATFQMGNDAMQTPEDAARALRKIAATLETRGASGFFETILDDNGNDVGRFKLGPKDHPGEALKPGEVLAE